MPLLTFNLNYYMYRLINKPLLTYYFNIIFIDNKLVYECINEFKKTTKINK